MVSLFFLILQLLSALRLADGVKISLTNCADHCGHVQIPYPFGVGENCYHDRQYEIICNKSFSPPKPFLHQFNLEVLDINWPGRYSNLDPRSDAVDADDQKITVSLPPSNLCGSDGAMEVHSYDLRGSPYFYSRYYNVLVVEGCGGSIVLKNRKGDILTGCAAVCGSDADKLNRTNCYGVGCCQAPLLGTSTTDYLQISNEERLDSYEVALNFEQATNSCKIAVTLIESQSVNEFTRRFSSLQTFPTVLNWRSTISESQALDPSINYDNSTCIIEANVGPQCYCSFGYEGNPYLPYGCQLVEECRKCKRHCVLNDNPNGSGRFYACEKNHMFKRASIIGFSIGMGLMLLVLGCYWLYRYLRWKKEVKLKAKNFKRNGGLLLQQQMSSNEGIVEKSKIFTVTELEKATDNFNDNRILGQGGQGTVYKGMLLDGKIVAVKKSKKVDESQVEQFINEVVILSQINHRNVVKLLGCCLETEVPVLVYEFISNGTLYEQIHGEGDDFHMSWKMRLQVAAESAGAVAYLHSSSSAPIFHRDIKSANILLDDKFRAKVSDFGTSRAVTIEQTHVTTAVLGTYGYLDPEYFQSNQFTEKSDVYSFGVVLVELITGKKPVCPTGTGGWIGLATQFLSHMKDSRLFDILDTRILDEGKEDEFMAVAELARKCLNMNGKLRPTMKELAVLLDGIRSSHMPILKDLIKPADSNGVVPEMIDSSTGSFSKSMFSLDDYPSTCSIDIQPQ